MLSNFILAISSLAIAAAPAAAANTPAAPKKNERAEASKADSRKYCLSYERSTGSRVESTVCKTKRSWAAEGVNVDELER